MSWTCAGFFKLNNGLRQVFIQFKKSLHKSDLFRHESISKLPGGKPMNVLSLVRGHHIRSGNLEMLSCLNKLELCGIFFLLKNGLGQVFIQFKKSLYKSDSFRRESISKLPGLIRRPQTKGKNIIFRNFANFFSFYYFHDFSTDSAGPIHSH